MTPTIKPWARGPWEVLYHAETHYVQGADFDRRIAMIGFDNSIEFSIAAYLNLKPVHRGGKVYAGEQVAAWLTKYQTRIEFFYTECETRGVTVVAEIEEVLWVHGVRNEHYHGGGTSYPGTDDLDAARALAIQVFAVLFDEPDTEALMEKRRILDAGLPERNAVHDKRIDDRHGLVEVGGELEYTSTIMHAMDPHRYRQMAIELADYPGLEAPE